MPTVVQFRRGNTSQNDAFTGAVGEISIDTELDVIRVHDGSTAGGFAQVGLNSEQTITNKVYQGTSISVTGNVTGNYIIGNGSQLTGLPEGYTNANVVTLLSAYGSNTISTTGNVTSGNLLTSGLVSASGNITGGNLSGTNISGTLTTASQTNITAVGTLTSLNSGTVSSSGNITGANLLTAGLISAASNIAGGNIITTGLVSANTLTTSGNAVIGGDLVVNGNVTYINISDLAVEDPIISLGRGANNAPLTSDDNKDRGEQLWYFDSTEKSAFVGWDDSTKKLFAATDVAIANEIVTVNSYGSFVVGGLEGATVSVSGNVDAGNLRTAGLISATGTITGSQFNGSGAGLTNIPGANVTGTLSVNTTGYAATVSGAAQANITSVGTLTALSVSGNVQGGNLRTAGLISATGQVTGSQFNGSGAGLTSIPGANVTGTVANATYATSAGSATTATSATTAGTVTTAAQGNITSVGTLTSLNSGTISSSGNITGANLLTSGNVSATNIAGTLTTASQTNITAVGTLGSLAVTANIQGGNLRTAGLISATGTVTGSQFNGSGAGLTNIPGANVTGTVANATYATSAGSAATATSATSATTAGTVTTAAQANITSVGTLTSLSVSGNVTAGNVSATNIAGTLTTASQTNVTAVGTLGSLAVTANVQGGNLRTAGLVSATGTITGSSLNAGNITINTDTITSSNSTLTIDPSAAGATGLVVIAGNLQVQGTTTTIDSTIVAINDLMINVANNAANTTQANGGGLGVGPVGSEYVKLMWDSAGNTWDSTHGISAIGTVTATQFTGSGAGLSALNGANISSGTIPAARLSGTYTITVSGAATTAGTVTTAAQPNITSVGTLTALAVTGNITAGNITTSGSGGNITGANVIGATTISTTQIINSGSNGVGNIGSSTTYFNTVFAKATSAQYADLAEMYAADAEYAPGTVLVFGGTAEVTASNSTADSRVVGVVSTNPAYIMNSGLSTPFATAVALQGRVPCKVTGSVKRGDMMVSSVNGAAVACSTPAVGTVIGKAIEDFDGESGVVEVLIGKV